MVIRMGIHGSTIRTAGGKLVFEPKKKKSSRTENGRIGILAFEVASVMSKLIHLWQSLSEQEMHRFRAEVLKSEGVLNLVSDNEVVLLSLACMEKLQDLTSVAHAVSRLGKRCHEPALVGFEHIYNDILKQDIDVSELEFPPKVMEAKVKKMEKYIRTTGNLYQELEMLTEMEQALRRLRDEGDSAPKDSRHVLEQKVMWQRQEIKYLKEISLWNRTYDKIVGMLAQTICTMYGRITRVFGFPICSWPEILSVARNAEAEYSGSSTSCLSNEEPKISNCSVNGSISPVQNVPPVSSSSTQISTSSYSLIGFQDNNASAPNGNLMILRSTHQSTEIHVVSSSFSPASQFSHQRSMSANYASRPDRHHGSSPMGGMPSYDDFATRSIEPSSYLLGTGPLGKKADNKSYFDPNTKLQNAPSSTLGGAALALHYANIIVIIEKMVRYPHLISQDTRDDLYQMLPKNVRMSLRTRLKSFTRACVSPEYWKEVVERVLSWLASLAHNMIRWQSEHNFEQQHGASRTSNVLLLQTLYFANQVKAELAVVELLVGLNYLWRHERETSSHDFGSNKDLSGYLDCQL